MAPLRNYQANRLPKGILFLMLAVPVAIFWRPHLFFIMDDLTELWKMASLPFWQYVVDNNGEQWFPIFHLIFYPLVRMAGEHYSLLVLLNCLGTGINAFLLYLLLRHHFQERLALVLGLFYAGAAVNYASIWMVFYLSLILSLGFLLLSLLLTRRYCHTPSSLVLLGVALTAMLSVLSNNCSCLSLGAIPLYALLLGEGNRQKSFWLLSGVVAGVGLLFTVGYFSFNYPKFGTGNLPRVPWFFLDPRYVLYWLLGSFLYPASFLFWVDYFLPPLPAFLVGIPVLTLLLSIIFLQGAPQEKRLLLWALAFNALPFLLISVIRYRAGIDMAGGLRYGVFSLVGILFLLGAAWQALARRLPPRPWAQTFLPLALLAAMVLGQMLSSPSVRRLHLTHTQRTKDCYEILKAQGFAQPLAAPEAGRLFCPKFHPFLTQGQAAAIGRFLESKWTWRDKTG